MRTVTSPDLRREVHCEFQETVLSLWAYAFQNQKAGSSEQLRQVKKVAKPAFLVRWRCQSLLTEPDCILYHWIASPLQLFEEKIL